MSPRSNGRRGFLAAASLGVLVVSPLGWLLGERFAGIAHAGGRSTRRVAERLRGLLRAGGAARQIGRTYLWQRTPTPTRDALVASLVPPVEQEAALQAERWELRQFIRDAVEADFEAVRLVPIGGWLLAETEAELCALTVDPGA